MSKQKHKKKEINKKESNKKKQDKKKIMKKETSEWKAPDNSVNEHDDIQDHIEFNSCYCDEFH